ncbi:major facilitator superfamily domain-containing protein 6-like [Palaemon carinicauda]|uniref:major facilitator superfamily domain-containing protein 6-like n=1 Tax=Palaemon carinicauda TaxID=392227 RepID=UPI0035B675E5
MFSKINKKLLPFKAYYFLKSGGLSFMPLYPVMASQKGITEEGLGIIWTITPITTASYNILTGTIADKFKIHRILMQINCVIMAIFMTAYFYLPSIPVEQEMTQGSLSAHCTRNDNQFIFCYHQYNDSVNEKLTFCNVENHFNTSKGMESCSMQCQISPEYSFPQAQNQEVSHVSQVSAFRIPSQDFCSKRKCFHLVDISAFKLINESCSSEFDITCSHSCPSDGKSNEMSLSDLLKTTGFWLTLSCLVISQGTFLSSSSLVDTLCHVALGKKGHKFGQQRLFGAMGLGLMALTGGAIVNYYSKGKPEPDYTAAVVITASFQIFSIIITKWINVTVPGKQEGTSSVGDVLYSLRFWLLVGTVLVTGLTYGTIWPFEFTYLDEVARQWDPAFDDSKLLQGFSLFVDCFIGEVLFCFFSAHIIKKITCEHTFTLTLAATALRVFLYSITTNPWLFLPIHILHGLSFGVFFANMITSTGKMAPKGAQATLQSAVTACFTLGRSLGALVGGILIRAIGGSRTYFIMGVIVSSYTIFYILFTCFILKKKSPETTGDHLGDYTNVNERRTQITNGLNEDERRDDQIFGSIHQLDAMS